MGFTKVYRPDPYLAGSSVVPVKNCFLAGREAVMLGTAPGPPVVAFLLSFCGNIDGTQVPKLLSPCQKIFTMWSLLKLIFRLYSLRSICWFA